MQHDIAGNVDSLRRESFNRKLADTMAKLTPNDLEFQQLQIGALPPYNQVDDDNPAASVVYFEEEVHES